MMSRRRVIYYLNRATHDHFRMNGIVRSESVWYHGFAETDGEELPAKWYEKNYPKLSKLANFLKGVDCVDGRLINVSDGSIIVDDLLKHKMHTFKSLVRVFIGSPSVQQSLKNSVMRLTAMGKESAFRGCFGNSSERQALVLNSLTQVSSFLNISAQQRKHVRLTICPQVTQHRIWTGALDEILNGLKVELNSLNRQCPNKATKMGQQIVSSCLRFLDDAVISHNHESASWMRPTPMKEVNSADLHKWEDVLEMFCDLIQCLESEKSLVFYAEKLQAMKEGLSHIKNVLVDKSIGYRDSRHQESLVQKKLTKMLGHSSPCLFTLLLYYLFGCIRDIEVDVCGGITGDGQGKRFRLYMGRILTSEQENIVWSGVKQLDRVLGLFKFIWETAEMKGTLEMQGHLWCVGAEDKTLTYKGNVFFVHGIML